MKTGYLVNLISLLLIVPHVSCDGSLASEFFIGFPKSSFNFEVLRIFITTPHREQVRVLIDSLRNYSTTVNVRAGIATEVRLPPLFEVQNSSDVDKGLWIHSSNSEKHLSVKVMKHATHSSLSGTYLALPPITYPHLQQYTYYLSSYRWANRAPVNYSSTLLLVGSHANTSVTITPSQQIQIPQVFLSPSYPQAVVNAGESYTIMLQKMQTLHLESKLDFTGTKIVSNKPLTVLGSHECVDIPHGMGFCDFLIEQFPPTVTWGRFFLLTSLHSRLTGELYRIIGMKSQTNIKVKCIIEGHSNLEFGHITLLLNSTGEVRELMLQKDRYCSIIANKPILVVQYSLGFSLDEVGDPFMLQIPPVEQYSNNYTVKAPLSYNSHVTITVPLKFFNSTKILVNGTALEDWSPIFCSDSAICGYGIRTRLPVGTHTIAHTDPNARILASVYGFAYHDGYGYQAGMELDRITDVCQHGDTRLDPSSMDESAGNVEICHDGVWTSVCGSDDWSDTEASVACKQLGYSQYGSAGSSLRSSKILWPSIVGSIHCTGSENRLVECFQDWEVVECPSDSHAHIQCHPDFQLSAMISTHPSLPYHMPNPATLICSTSVNTTTMASNTAMQITWTRGNTPLYTSGYHSMTDAVIKLVTNSSAYFESSLTFHIPKPSDNGSYTCLALIVSNLTGRPLSRQASSSVFVTVVEAESQEFQLRLTGIGRCSDWLLQHESPKDKAAQVIKVITEHIESVLCSDCRFTVNHISDAAFTCFGQNADKITFRGRIYATNHIRITQAVDYLREWVGGGPSLRVGGMLLSVDPGCAVVIGSFNSQECGAELETTTMSSPPIYMSSTDSAEQLTKPSHTGVTDPMESTPTSPHNSGGGHHTQLSPEETDPLCPKGTSDNLLPGSTDAFSDRLNVIIIAGGTVFILLVLILSITCVAVVISCLKYRSKSSRMSTVSAVTPFPLSVYDDPVGEKLEDSDDDLSKDSGTPQPPSPHHLQFKETV